MLNIDMATVKVVNSKQLLIKVLLTVSLQNNLKIWNIKIHNEVFIYAKNMEIMRANINVLRDIEEFG